MSDEYYVLEKIQNGKEIPSDKSNAIKLCSVSEKFLSDNISPGMTDYDKELAIHDFIVENCEYSFSDANDMSEYYAYGALVNKKAVCSGYARATALLLKCCDVDVNLISGDADNNTGDSSADGVSDTDGLIAPDGTVVDGHMWNQVKIDGLWYNLDTTWDDPIGETELRHTYFNVDDSILGLNHEWDKKEAEQCSSTLQNYYEKNGIFFKTSSSFKDALSEYLAAGNRDEYECAVSYVDTNEEFLSFIFDYEGITSYQVATRGEESAYQILTIYFNPEPE
jgi:transglutaminase/protease-like cytokinesis protein 3